MSDDIVTRLRHIHMELTVDDYDDVITEAADEIERLRALADQLAEELRANHDTSNPTSVECPSCVALTAYEAARKETT